MKKISIAFILLSPLSFAQTLMKNSAIKLLPLLFFSSITINLYAASPFQPEHQFTCSLYVNTTVSNASCWSCNDGSAQVNVFNGTPPFTYSWSTGDTESTAFNLYPGPYTVCVTDMYGCFACDSFVVDSMGCSGFYVNVTPTNASCSTCTDGSATASPSSGAPYTYTWNTVPPQYTQTANNLGIGTYSVCVTNAATCTACAGVTIDSFSCSGFYVNVATTNASCGTCYDGIASAFASGGTPPYTYSWSTGDTTQTIYNLGWTMDSVRVTDANGCNVYGFAFIDTTNCPGFYVYGATITNATCSTCSDGYAVAQVSSGSPPYTYSWGTSPVQTGQTATGLSPGNYDVCASDMTGCSACNNVTIGVGNCSAYFYMYPDTSLPNTYNAVNMATGVPPITYAWTWGDGSPLDSVAYPSHTYSALGVYTICLTITDSTGCMATSCDSVFLHRPSFLLIAVNVLPPVTTGISSYTPEKTFSVFPNPASDNLILRLPRADTAYVTIYNALGEIKFVSVITQRETTLNISSFSGGIYFIEVASGNKVSREKFVKQ